MPIYAADKHPMDHIDIRAFDFDYADISLDHTVWSQSSPEFSIFINALGVHVPYFERYLVRALNMAKREIDDPQLRKDIVAITAQEAHHARNFIAYNKWLSRKYPKIAVLDAEARDYFSQRGKKDKLKRLLGFTAGYETFTFLAGMIILNNYDKWLSESHPVMKALWVWHQVEEVEHGEVAFNVYKALYGEHEFYRKWMVLYAGYHIVKETFRAYFHMCRIEGYFKNPFRAAKALYFFTRTFLSMAWHARPIFLRRYKPRAHPLVTTKQNPIAVAWRHYVDDGGTVLEIDKKKMNEIMRHHKPV